MERVFRPASADADDMHTRRRTSHIFKVPVLELCIESRVNRKYMSGTSALARKSYCSRQEGYTGNDTISGACSPFLSSILVSGGVWDGCRLADYVVCRRKEFRNNFIFVKALRLLHCKLRTMPIAVEHLTPGMRTAIHCLNAYISFDVGTSHQYKMRNRKRDRAWSLQRRA